MAIEFPAANFWAGKPVIVFSMQDVARDTTAWAAYLKLTSPQREEFKLAVAMPNKILKFNEFLAYISPATVVAPPQFVTPPTPWPASMPNSPNDVKSFLDWVTTQASLVEKNTGLAFHLGPRYALISNKMETWSVPICIRRNGGAVANTSFVFHYHPGVTGPGVGHGAASKWHFKPKDNSPTFLRIEAHQFDKIAGTLVKNAQERAQGKP